MRAGRSGPEGAAQHDRRGDFQGLGAERVLVQRRRSARV